jgi:hypothetical protein
VSNPLATFPEFIAAVRARLEAGAEAYGDQSFERPTAELVRELQQEALDLAGWGFILFERLRRLEAVAKRADEDAASAERPVRADW